MSSAFRRPEFGDAAPNPKPEGLGSVPCGLLGRVLSWREEWGSVGELRTRIIHVHVCRVCIYIYRYIDIHTHISLYMERQIIPTYPDPM